MEHSSNTSTNVKLIQNSIETKLQEERIRMCERYKSMFTIVRDFVISKSLMLYGGFALNEVLPTVDKIYDEYELPDYDFFSPTARQHAIELANRYHVAGYSFIEVKEGLHESTYKVFVEFKSVADVTQLPPNLYRHFKTISKKEKSLISIYNSSQKYSIAPMSYLRYSMHYELSHPEGHIERWMKVYPRFMILFHRYPIQTNSLKCVASLFKPINDHIQIVKIITEYIITQKYPIVGSYAAIYYLRQYDKQIPSNHFIKCLPILQFLSNSPVESINNTFAHIKLKSPDISSARYSIVNKKPNNSYELEKSSLYIELNTGKKLCIVESIKPSSCFTFVDDGLSRIGNFDTTIALLYTHYLFENKSIDIICLINHMYIQLLSPRTRKGKLKERFGLDCYGEQSSINTIRKEKYAKQKFVYIPRNKN